MTRYYHVSSARNRDSISAHGLDWRRMGAAAGIAGSPEPEIAGVFVIDTEFDAEFFLRFSPEPVDIWCFEADEADLVDYDNGYRYLPRRVPPAELTLYRRDLVPPRHEADAGGSAYGSTLTITHDDPPTD